MKSSTERPLRRPENQKAVRAAKTKRYARQTAHVEARRDGKPLIFGWGGHLSRTEKTRIQRRATWAIAGLIGLLIIGVILGAWININVIIPGLPISTVNGHQIPQSQYRKMVAFKTELELQKLNGPHGLNAQKKSLEQQDLDQQNIISTTTKQITDLTKQIKALPPGSNQLAGLKAQLKAAQDKQAAAQAQHAKLTQQITNLTQNTIPIEQQGFTQSQIGNDSASWLQDDEIIREWLATQSSTVQAKVNASTSQINSAMNDFKANVPTTSSYSQFLKQDGVSDDDMRVMMTIKLRRDNMQNYLASLEVSPTYQVLARSMTFSTMADAQKALKKLQQGADFGKLAKASSVDTTTNTKGGDMGWLARGQYAQTQQAAVVENWLFDPARKIGELSPILTENGGYHIVQVMGIDPSRPVDPSTLQTLKINALSDWLLMERALPSMHITQPDQNRLFDPTNLPPDLPSAAPAQSVPGAPGAPGSLPGGGVPGQP